MWTVLSATIMFADKPHRLNERTSAQRFCVLTILPPVTALAVGLPAQRAIAQRFRALAQNGPADSLERCPLLEDKRTCPELTATSAFVQMIWGERRGHGTMGAVQRLPMELTH